MSSTWPSGTPSLIPFLTWTKLGKRRCQKKGTVTWTEVPDQDGSGVLNQRPPLDESVKPSGGSRG